MGVQKTKRKSGIVYRAYWKNPFTKKKEYGPWESEKADASKLDSLMGHRLKYEREYFQPQIEEGPANSDDLTVNEVCLAYMQGGEMTDSTRRDSWYHVKAVTPFLGDVFVSELDKKYMKALEKYLRVERELKQNTINRKVSIIRSALNWAAEEGLIEENPIDGYVCKRGKDKKFEPPTRKETEKLFQKASPHVRRAIIIGWHTGVRIGPSELLKMEWSRFITISVKEALPDYASAKVYQKAIYQWIADGLLAEKTLKRAGVLQWLEESDDALLIREDVVEHMGTAADKPVRGRFRIMAALKNDEMPWRELPIEGSILPMVIRWRDEDTESGIPWVIHFNGKRISTFKKAWKATKARAKVRDDIRPYDLRHAFITYALEQGADMKAVGKLAGHADETMILRRYQHVVGEMESDAAKAVPTLDTKEKKPKKRGTPKRHPSKNISTHFQGADKNNIQ
ncbi:hypothetical protein SYK_02390 [Pseudodesulfovibrio nedwellii]|uniref:Tyr recombinase domain-containing protein n=1 Tax=Pseudodesulfovibrio nedwellii TaxID=2973072 RepID=A0ABM8AWG1_9BACT|nr:site-specific integrase [Pseudodesulfovibrio nedwellii]BDQ35879.1 hypothetical protein SYK_02390 [Pseudodesulfovibrio nedwellii]